MHKEGSWHLHKNPTMSIQTWVLNHIDDVFYFQDVGEINGIEVPFNINIQSPMQLASMLEYGHNGVISMDATFGTNDVEFHFFKMMVFDACHANLPVEWIIMSHQTCNDLVE